MPRIAVVVCLILSATSLARAQIAPSGNISQDCANELRQYCRAHLNPSAHRPCLETQVKDVSPLCQASMDKNGIKRKN